MNTIRKDSHFPIRDSMVRDFDCKPPRGEVNQSKGWGPQEGRGWGFRGIARDCGFPPIGQQDCGKDKGLSEETFKNIIQELSTTIRDMVGTLGQAFTSFIDYLTKQQTPPPATPAPETPPAPGTPPPSTPAPTTPAPTTPAPTTPAPTTETPKKKETEPKKNKLDDAKALNGNGEFLWKPISDKDGKLAIVLPGNLTGKVKSVSIVNEDGKVLGKGTYSGTGNPMKNGEREHYRFGKDGKSFPDGSYVQIVMDNSNVKKVKIGDTSNRVEK